MKWTEGLIFLLLFLLLCLLLFLPLRIHFQIEHQERWKGTLTISLLGAAREIVLPDLNGTPFEGVEERMEHTSFKIDWGAAWLYMKKVLRTINRHSYVENYQLQCQIGCSRPDCTAYLYGAFWSILSALPQKWLEQGSITYLPDFQRERKELFFEGIIRCRIGQLIIIVVSVFWLTVVSIWKQRKYEQQKQEQTIIRQFGEEQMVYES